jgi:hypothetical protein
VLLVVALVAAAVLLLLWFATRGFTEDEAGLMARVSRSDHPAIREV